MSAIISGLNLLVLLIKKYINQPHQHTSKPVRHHMMKQHGSFENLIDIEKVKGEVNFSAAATFLQVMTNQLHRYWLSSVFIRSHLQKKKKTPMFRGKRRMYCFKGYISLPMER